MRSAPDSRAQASLASSASAYRSPTCSTCAPAARIRATFAGDEIVGTKMRAGTPKRCAANATAAPWFPPDAATTPAGGGLRRSRFANAPRALNEPEYWRNSSLRVIRTSRARVRRRRPRRRACAGCARRSGGARRRSTRGRSPPCPTGLQLQLPRLPDQPVPKAVCGFSAMSR